MRLSSRIAVLYSVIMLAFTIGLSYFVFLVSAGTLKDHVTEHLLDTAAHTMDKLDRVLYNKYLDVRFLAADPVIRSRASKPGELKARLKEFIGLHKTYTGAVFSTMDGAVIASTAEDARDDRWERPLVSGFSGDGSKVEISRSAGPESALMRFASVVKDEAGVPLGVVTANLPLNFLFEIIEKPLQIDVGGDYEVELVDASGFVLYSNHDRANILKNVSTRWPVIMDRLESEKVGTFVRDSPGGGIYAFAAEKGFMDFKGNAWTLIYDFPGDIAFAPAEWIKNAVLAVSILTGAALLAAIYFASKRLTRPLERLALSAGELGKGNLETEIDAGYSGRDEIGRLAEAFRHMALNLKESRNRLLAYSGELERSRKNLAEAQRITSLGSWDWDIPGNRINWSDGVYRILGREEGGLDGAYEAFLDCVHHEDREHVKKSVFESFYNTAPYSIEHRVVRPDGSVRFVRQDGEVSMDQAGRPRSVVGTIQDITEKRAMEESLRLNEERYRLLAENARDIIYRYELGPQRRFSFISQSCLNTTGYSQAEFYADPDLVLKIVHPGHEGALKERIKDGTFAPLLLKWVHKDGAEVWIEQHEIPVYGPGGDLAAIEGIARDVTESVRSQEELKKANSELQEALGKVKLLSGFLPICASCKKIRDDSGYWNQIEEYIRTHSEAEFTHSLCPDCVEDLYPDFSKRKRSDPD